MEPLARSSYVVGYADAWGVLDGYKSNSDGLLKNSSYGEVVAGLDHFYSALENLILPIIEALRLWTRKAQGEEPEIWAKHVATSLRVWRQMADGK